MNNSRQVVGEGGFIWSNGHVEWLPNFGGQTSAWGINDVGQVVGYSTTSSGNWRAFLYANGQMQAIAGANSRAECINNLGQVTGSGPTENGDDRAFIWSNGSMLDLNLPGIYSRGLAVNDSGDVVGFYSDYVSVDHTRPFLYSNGTIKDLGLPAGAIWGGAQDINSGGQIVGDYTDTSGEHAAIYLNGQMRDLTSVLPPNSGWALTEAFDINDSGQIVGYGRFNGVQSAYLLTPTSEVPEPSTLLVWSGLGVTGAVMAWRRRKGEAA